MLGYHPGVLIMLQKCTSARWCSCPGGITQVWICYQTIARVLYDECPMSDRCWTSQGSYLHLQPHPTLQTSSATPLVFLSIFKTAPPSADVAVQWGLCWYGYSTRLCLMIANQTPLFLGRSHSLHSALATLSIKAAWIADSFCLRGIRWCTVDSKSVGLETSQWWLVFSICLIIMTNFTTNGSWLVMIRLTTGRMSA